VQLSDEYADKHGARCLDGTAATYHYLEGTVDKVVVYLQGGGFCFGYGD
jgi:hypothetical protein